MSEWMHARQLVVGCGKFRWIATQVLITLDSQFMFCSLKVEGAYRYTRRWGVRAFFVGYDAVLDRTGEKRIA
jgi:hypothetical protein